MIIKSPSELRQLIKEGLITRTVIDRRPGVNLLTMYVYWSFNYPQPTIHECVYTIGPPFHPAFLDVKPIMGYMPWSLDQEKQLHSAAYTLFQWQTTSSYWNYRDRHLAVLKDMNKEILLPNVPFCEAVRPHLTYLYWSIESRLAQGKSRRPDALARAMSEMEEQFPFVT